MRPYTEHLKEPGGGLSSQVRPVSLHYPPYQMGNR